MTPHSPHPETGGRRACPECGKNVIVRNDGLLTNHYPASGGRMWCDGGGDRRPASMLQPATFSGGGDDEARRVSMRPADETEDEW